MADAFVLVTYTSVTDNAIILGSDADKPDV